MCPQESQRAWKRLVSRINVTVDKLNTNVKLVGRQVLENLHPSEMNPYHRPPCLDQTCILIRQKLLTHLLSDTETNVIWLYGCAGCGKSTISKTISENLTEMRHLGAYLFFERGKSSSDPSTVVKTIAYSLAHFDSSLRLRIVASLKENVGWERLSAEKQFEKLLLQPIQAVKDEITGPVVIILDALDECGNLNTRKGLIRVFEKFLDMLPRNFRILITSRPERDIDKCLRGKKSVSLLELDHTSKSSKQDVRKYLDNELRASVSNEDCSIPNEWDSKMDILGEAAAGLFIWASTVIKLVSDSDDPLRKLDNLVNDPRILSKFGLDELYTTVLHTSGISWDDSVSKERCCQLLGLIIFGKMPLSIDDIEALLGFSPRILLSRLTSVLHYKPNEPTRFYHASFGDYLVSPDRLKDAWHIDTSRHNQYIVSRCFDIMVDKLSFNICGLTTSYFPNDELEWLPNRIEDKIPSHLKYVCRNWGKHLLDTSYSSEVLHLLSRFLDTHLLFWFELMSLIKAFDTCAWSLLDAMKWVSVSFKSCNICVLGLIWIQTNSPGTTSFLADARRLVNQFYIPISHSTPHLYISALPFASKNSNVAAHYMRNTDSLVQITRYGKKLPLSALMVLKPEGFVFIYTVKFSKDGSRIFSGSHDGILRVWDSESGTLLSELYNGDGSRNPSILSLSPSPDGQYIACGTYEGVRVWDLKSSKLILAIGGAYIGNYCPVCFSPDSRRIVSTSFATICVWDALNGRELFKDLRAHSDLVSSICYSPDGNIFASASCDGSIYIWDASRGTTISKPFEGHSDGIRSIAFSPDGRRIVSGSDDCTIRVWDITSGKSICDPLEGHTGSVLSVAFSPDGSRIVSSSSDKSVRVWDPNHGATVLGPLDEHTSNVWGAEFSPDGTRIISCSDDGLIRVWDSENSTPDSETNKGHLQEMMSANFSLDGKLVVSGSIYGIIHVWDVVSGRLIYELVGEEDDDICSIAFSADNSRVVTGSINGSISVWDIKEASRVAGPLFEHKTSVLGVAFSLDGSQLYSASSDGTQRTLLIESGLSCGPPEPHHGILWPAAVSPDMTRIAHGSYDGVTRVFDAISNEAPLGTYEGHQEPVQSVAFSSDGQYIVTSSLDSSIRVSKLYEGASDDSDDITKSWTLKKDGWIVGKQQQLLLWVPHAFHKTLWRPNNTAILNCAFSTRLDFNGSYHGERWTECYKPVEQPNFEII